MGLFLRELAQGIVIMDASTSYGPNRAADVILRSSDNKLFYVLGALLRYASPVFMDMLLLNQDLAAEENEAVDGCPVVPLEEDSATVHLLLDCLYPQVEEPQLNDVSLLWKVGRAAQKYLIEVVEGKLKKWMLDSELLSSEPFRTYAVAVGLGWEHLATEAACCTRQIPLEGLPFIEELHSITGSDFYRLLEYRLRCANSFDTKAETLLKIPNPATSGPAEIHTLSPDMNERDIVDAVDAAEPFGSTAVADLILRSSDSVDFFVIEVILRLASPVFSNMFPLESYEVKNGLAVVPVDEESNVLYELLAIIYPNVDDLNIRDFKLYKEVVRAARAYQMVVVEKKLRVQALASPLILGEPLRLYILATSLHWEDVAKVAALNSLSNPLKEMSFVEEMNNITGADLYRLMDFRFRCGNSACDALEAYGRFPKYGPSQWQDWWNGGETKYKSISLEELYTRVRACPQASTINRIYTLELEKFVKMSNMTFNGRSQAFRRIVACQNDIGGVIEKAVLQVPLNKPDVGSPPSSLSFDF